MTTTAAQTTNRQELYMGDDAGTLVAIYEMTDVRPPNLSRGMMEATTHSSSADDDGGVPQEFVPDGTYDPGDIQLTVNEIPGGAQAEAIEAAFANRAKKYFKLVDGTAVPPTFKSGYGYIQSYNPVSRPAHGKALKTAQVSIKRTGVWQRGAA